MNRTWVNAFGFIFLMATTAAWAVPVPDTGQTKCYNDAIEIPCPSPGQPFYGQDANFNINPMSYTKLDGSGNSLPDSATSWVMVRDNVTGLIWEVKTNKDGFRNYNNPHDADNTYSWYDSNPDSNGGYAGNQGDGTDTEDFINALNNAHFGGYSDWRLPTVKELTYILTYSTYSSYSPNSSGPWINTGYFPNTQPAFYFSSTTTAEFYLNVWGVSFGSDSKAGAWTFKANDNYVRAVRGGQSGSSGSFTDNGDGTVTDTSTGLMWQQTSTNYMNWEQALLYCEGLVLTPAIFGLNSP